MVIAGDFKLTSQKALDSQFSVYGKFYNVKMNENLFKCRSEAIIERKDTHQDHYDSLFVLMNPGGCEQLDDDIPLIKSENEIQHLKAIPAQSDPTQHQIMRLMELRNWNKVGVINLSDLRSGQANQFYKDFSHAKRVAFSFHQIFNDSRDHERNRIIEKCKGPIILGWSVNKRIIDLACHAYTKLPSDSCIGLKKSECLYYHPGQMLQENKKAWLYIINLILTEIHGYPPFLMNYKKE